MSKITEITAEDLVIIENATSFEELVVYIKEEDEEAFSHLLLEDMKQDLIMFANEDKETF